MSEAPKTGLRLAAAPAAGASTTALATALAGASVDDITASLSDEQRTKLAASLAPAAAAAAKPGNDKEDAEDEADGGDDEDKEGEGDGEEPGDKKMKKAKATAFAAGQKASAERVAAVASSEHFEGREKAAMKLLGSDKLLGASAEDVIGLLADMPKGSEATAEMLAALRGKNPDLGSGDDTGASNASGDHGWGKAQAKARKLFGHAASAKPGK